MVVAVAVVAAQRMETTFLTPWALEELEALGGLYR
jgi:hypothetical protein